MFPALQSSCMAGSKGRGTLAFPGILYWYFRRETAWDKPHLCCLLAVKPGTGYANPLCLSFFSPCKY